MATSQNFKSMFEVIFKVYMVRSLYFIIHWIFFSRYWILNAEVYLKNKSI